MDESNETIVVTTSTASTTDSTDRTEGLVRAQKEPGGFWVPNAVIDVHLPIIGPVPMAVYCVLCRCTTLAEYPSVGEVARQLDISSNRARAAISLLCERGLLNAFDLAAIRGTRFPASQEASESEDRADLPGIDDAIG